MRNLSPQSGHTCSYCVLGKALTEGSLAVFGTAWDVFETELAADDCLVGARRDDPKLCTEVGESESESVGDVGTKRSLSRLTSLLGAAELDGELSSGLQNFVQNLTRS